MLDKIYIKGTEYLVEQVDKVDNDGSYGECDKMNKIIKVKKNLNPREKHLTFFHEFFHAILHEVAVDQIVPPEIEEILVDNCASGILQIMQQLGEFNKEDKKTKPKGKRRKK